MKKLLLLALPLLAACTVPPSTRSIERENVNPLTAAQYGDELSDALSDLVIQKDPIIERDGMLDEIQRHIGEAKRISRAAKEEIARGRLGEFITINEDLAGTALLVSGATLYVSPTFSTEPGPQLHMYLSTVVDPREGTFPDESAIDLGVIQSPYGAQAYDVTLKEPTSAYRTVAIWDATLERLYGFAQLSQR